jgi:hypothetical protein
MAQIVGGIGEGARLTRYSSLQIVEAAGSQGVELLNWITLRGALTGKVGKIHSNYHIPISLPRQRCWCSRTTHLQTSSTARQAEVVCR